MQTSFPLRPSQPQQRDKSASFRGLPPQVQNCQKLQQQQPIKRDDSSGHKRSKTTLNFYPNMTYNANTGGDPMPFEVDKENKFIASNETAEMHAERISKSLLQQNQQQQTFLKTYKEHGGQRQRTHDTNTSLKRNNSQDLQQKHSSARSSVLKNSSSIVNMS